MFIVTQWYLKQKIPRIRHAMLPSIDATLLSSDISISNLTSEISPDLIDLPSLTKREYNHGLSMVAPFSHLLPFKLRWSVPWPQPKRPTCPDDSLLVCRALSKLWEGHGDDLKRRELCAIFRHSLEEYDIIGKACPCPPLIKSSARLLKLIKRLPAQKERFSVPFEDQHFLLHQFISFLDTVTMKGSSSDYYSRSGIIVQSSCSGKSRMVVQVGDVLPVVYACCRADDGALSYPPRSPIKWNVLADIPDSVSDDLVDIFMFSRCIAFLDAVAMACTSVIRMCIKLSDEKKEMNFRRRFITSQYNDEFWDQLLKDANEGTNQIFEELALVYSEKNKDGEYWNEFEKILKTDLNTKFLPYSFPHIAMLFCIDESKLLANIFPRLCKQSLLAHIHRASRYVPQGFALIFMDTLADLNILLRSPFKATAPQAIGQREFVFTGLTNVDLGHVKDEGEASSLRQAGEVDFICGFGRPVWHAGRKCGSSWKDLLEEAITRLLSCQDIYEYKRLGKLTVPAATAIVANRVNLDLNAAFNDGSVLVNSHMAYVDCFTREDPFTSITYPSDPMLSLAAQYLLTGMDMWQPCLEKVSQSIRSGLIQPGERGEVAAQLAICHIIDNVVKEKICRYLKPDGAPAQWILLEDFLNALDPELVNDIPEGLEEAAINLTHFFKAADYVPSRRDLVSFVSRAAGVVLKNGCPGADLLIPLVMKTPWKGKVASKSTIFTCEYPRSYQVSELISKKASIIPEAFEVKIDECETNIGGVIAKDVDPFIDYELIHPNTNSSKRHSTSTGSIGKGNIIRNNYYSLASDNISYILIQAKNLAPGTAWPRNLSLLNPFDVGVDSIENLDYNRPYVAMGIQFTEYQSSSKSKSKVVKKMNVSIEPTLKGNTKRTSNVHSPNHILAFRVVNPHFGFDPIDKNQESSIMNTFSSLVNVRPPSLNDLKKDKGQHIILYCKMHMLKLRHSCKARIIQPSPKREKPESLTDKGSGTMKREKKA